MKNALAMLTLIIGVGLGLTIQAVRDSNMRDRITKREASVEAREMAVVTLAGVSMKMRDEAREQCAGKGIGIEQLTLRDALAAYMEGDDRR